MIRTQAELTKAVRQARMISASLKAGARFPQVGERELIAALLETLADVAERKEGLTP